MNTSQACHIESVGTRPLICHMESDFVCMGHSGGEHASLQEGCKRPFLSSRVCSILAFHSIETLGEVKLELPFRYIRKLAFKEVELWENNLLDLLSKTLLLKLCVVTPVTFSWMAGNPGEKLHQVHTAL